MSISTYIWYLIQSSLEIYCCNETGQPKSLSLSSSFLSTWMAALRSWAASSSLFFSFSDFNCSSVGEEIVVRDPHYTITTEYTLQIWKQNISLLDTISVVDRWIFNSCLKFKAFQRNIGLKNKYPVQSCKCAVILTKFFKLLTETLTFLCLIYKSLLTLSETLFHFEVLLFCKITMFSQFHLINISFSPFYQGPL